MESCRTCGCQCHRKLFSFAIDDISQKDFILSQWTDRPVVYALYRSLLSAYTLSVVVYSAMNNVYGAKILIWLTYWSYYVMTAGFLIRALTVWFYIHRLKDKDRPLLPRPLLQIQWVLLTLTCSIAPLVSLLFWTVEYNGKGVDFKSGNTHGVNLVLVMVDLFISRYPIRIHHFYLGACYCFTYAIFTVIYWSLGGTNHRGQPYVYGVLDYSGNPGKALIFMFTVPLIVAPLLHCVTYGLYRARTLIWQKCCAQTQHDFPETLVALNTTEGTAV